MFEGSEYPKSLDQQVFEEWLLEGRASKISYRYLLIVWSELESEYQPVYAESKETIDQYQNYGESTG